MAYFMGIDLGTSSVKALITDERGSALGFGQRGYDIRKPRMNYAEQDMERLWDCTVSAIRGALASCPDGAERIAGIGFSGQMHGLVPADRDGRPVRDAVIWADQRSGEEIEDIYRAIPREEYQSVTLNALSTGFLIPSLLWVKKREPENFKRIDKVLLPKDYIRSRMCGRFGTDATDASGTAVFDTKGRQWAWDFIRRLGLPAELFPECHEAYEIAGEVTAACAEQTGLKKGTPVVYGGGDTPMQALGNGMTGPGYLVSNIGTASQISSVMGEAVHDKAYRTNTFCHVCGNTWMLSGANLSGGVALKWLMREILQMESYDAMTALAGQVPPGSDGLLFFPCLCGERTPYNDPGARGVYLGLTLGHTRGHLIRSAMEGIVFELKNSLSIFDELGVRYDRIIASGGGAGSRLFLELQADIFGREIYTNAGREQACMGAALTAAVGTGAFPDFARACESMVHYREEAAEPNMEHHKIYMERFEVYKRIYEQNRELF